MDLLGPSLWDVWNSQGQAMNSNYVACVAVEAIFILKELHLKGYSLSELDLVSYSVHFY